jgi:hypothetical protein
MLPLFDEIFLLCPEAPTGGPEALHQLGLDIDRHGGTAKMAYCGPHTRLTIDQDIIRCEGPGENPVSPMLEYFAIYQPQPLKEARLTPRSLVVFPEVMTELAVAPSVDKSRHALWWLSVDNALSQNFRLTDATYRQEFFSHDNLIHFYQSAYAHDFLKKAGAKNCITLSDYTDPNFIMRSLTPSGNPPIAHRPNVICFFPNKGVTLARQFIAHGTLRHAVELTPIIHMTKMQVRDTLFNSRIYIDFGHHPGKDRVPREAAIAGAIVLLHAKGAAIYEADHPLSTTYKFTEADIASGRLHTLIDQILDDPETHFTAQMPYREAILAERDKFDREVQVAFFKNM